MTVELVLGTITAIGGLIATLFGGGLLRQAFAHSNELAVQRHELTQTSHKVDRNMEAVRKLETDVLLAQKDIAGMKENLKRLELLPDINAKLSSLEKVVNFINQQISRNAKHEHTSYNEHQS